VAGGMHVLEEIGAVDMQTVGAKAHEGADAMGVGVDMVDVGAEEVAAAHEVEVVHRELQACPPGERQSNLHKTQKKRPRQQCSKQRTTLQQQRRSLRMLKKGRARQYLAKFKI